MDAGATALRKLFESSKTHDLESGTSYEVDKLIRAGEHYFAVRDAELKKLKKDATKKPKKASKQRRARPSKKGGKK